MCMDGAKRNERNLGAGTCTIETRTDMKDVYVIGSIQ